MIIEIDLYPPIFNRQFMNLLKLNMSPEGTVPGFEKFEIFEFWLEAQ
jgi:hypothetical protein